VLLRRFVRQQLMIFFFGLPLPGGPVFFVVLAEFPSIDGQGKR
jgi:hypothetical protein